jgi:hypothetical protein
MSFEYVTFSCVKSYTAEAIMDYVNCTSGNAILLQSNSGGAVGFDAPIVLNTINGGVVMRCLP